MPYHVGKERFCELVEQAIAELPVEFANFLDEVPVEVRDDPTPQQQRILDSKAGGLLLGLYQGRPRTMRSVEHSGAMPDLIFIFQGSIETICKNEKELIFQVRKTVLHEIGHHFGMSESDLQALGYG